LRRLHIFLALSRRTSFDECDLREEKRKKKKRKEETRERFAASVALCVASSTRSSNHTPHCIKKKRKGTERLKAKTGYDFTINQSHAARQQRGGKKGIGSAGDKIERSSGKGEAFCRRLAIAPDKRGLRVRKGNPKKSRLG